MQRCWVLKTREDKRRDNTIEYIPHWKDFKREQVIAIGWSVPQDPSFTWEELVAHIKQHSYPSDGNAVRAKQAAHKVWKFAKEMGIDDKVLLCDGYPGNSRQDVHIYGAARVTGKLVPDKSSTWWETKRKAKIVPREQDVAKEELANRLGLGSCPHAIHEIDCNAFGQLLKWLGIHGL